jgi:hypothetical protein
MLKVVIAFFLGVIGLFIGFGVGEGSGLVAGFVTLGVYCFLCQFLLSRKNVNAYRKNWPVMLALDAVWLFILCVMFLKEQQNAFTPKVQEYYSPPAGPRTLAPLWHL